MPSKNWGKRPQIFFKCIFPTCTPEVKHGIWKWWFPKKNLLFQGLIFRFHVKLQGCTLINKPIYHNISMKFDQTWDFPITCLDKDYRSLPYAHCSLLQSWFWSGLKGCLNTEPHKVFGALGNHHLDIFWTVMGIIVKMRLPAIPRNSTALLLVVWCGTKPPYLMDVYGCDRCDFFLLDEVMCLFLLVVFCGCLMWFLQEEHVEMWGITYIYIITNTFISLIFLEIYYCNYICFTMYNISSYLLAKHGNWTSIFLWQMIPWLIRGEGWPDGPTELFGQMIWRRTRYPKWDFLFPNLRRNFAIITIKCLEMSCMTASNWISLHTPKKTNMTMNNKKHENFNQAFWRCISYFDKWCFFGRAKCY